MKKIQFPIQCSMIFVFALIFSLIEVKAQNTFCQTIGGNGSDAGYSIIKTLDGGYAIVGQTESFGIGESDLYLIKLDNNFVIQWTKAYGTGNVDEGYTITQGQDSGFVIGGYYNMDPGFTGGTACLIKTDKQGNIVWAKNASAEKVYSVISCYDGGYAVVSGQLFGECYVSKLDNAGNTEWSVKSLNGVVGNNTLIQTPDSGFLVGGNQFYFLKLDANGNRLWSKKMTGGISANSLITTQDGGYAAAGQIISGGFYTVKFDASFALQWAVKIGEGKNEIAYTIVQTPDNGYVIGGKSADTALAKDVALFVKLDNTGQLLWTRKTGNQYGNTVANSLVVSSDSGIVFTGITDVSGFDVSYVYLGKLANSGLVCLGCDMGIGGIDSIGGVLDNLTDLVSTVPGFSSSSVYVDASGAVVGPICSATLGVFAEERTPAQFDVFPNPFNLMTTISFRNENVFQPSELFLYDITGEKVLSMKIEGKETKLKRGNLSSGIYFYEIKSGSAILGRGKLLIE